MQWDAINIFFHTIRGSVYFDFKLYIPKKICTVFLAFEAIQIIPWKPQVFRKIQLILRRDDYNWTWK